jgi:DNA (cytosine-5)-methyltransferase 1
MATFIDLTEASTPERPMRQVYRPRYETSGSSCSLQASKSYHYLHFQQSQLGETDDDKDIDLNIEDGGRVYPLSITRTTKRRSDFANMPRSLIEPSPPRSTFLPSTYAHCKDDVESLIKISTRAAGQSSLQSTWPRHTLEVPFSRLAISAAFPSAKRLCVGLQRSSMSGHGTNLTTSPYSEAELNASELKDAEREDDVIDLTISDNFPIWNYSKANPKRGILDFSEDSDASKQNSKAVQCITHPFGATDIAVNPREAEFSRRLAANGVKRRLDALGQIVRIDPRGIIDLSADSASDEEDEQNLELTQEPLRRLSIIGSEDYLSDDEISKRLANLNVGPNLKPSVTVKPTLHRTETEEARKGNSRYKAGKSAELKDGNFLRIVSVTRDENDVVFLSGHLLSRQNSCGRAMPKRRNELVWIVEMSRTEFDAGFGPTVVEVPLVEAIGIRSVTFTNQQYPGMSLKTYEDGGFKNIREELSTGPLFCRWKSIKVIGDRKQKLEDSFVHLTYAEADPRPKARIRPSVIRDMWRGSATTLGGSYFATRKASINLASAHSDSTSEQIQQYTFGDAFCGAGGCSSGASQAGLRVSWGFDKDRDAIRVYAANIGRREGAESLNEAVDEFYGRSDLDRFMVDVLHMSPPCQPFSAAHTVPSEIQDEINRAALLSVWHLLERIKPRVATIEETEGLVNRHVDWFNALINIFIQQGYSVRWKVVKCQDYGVPQQRKRLFIIAAG